LKIENYFDRMMKKCIFVVYLCELYSIKRVIVSYTV